MDLENQALGLLWVAGAGEESSTGGMLENLPDTLVRLSRALEILVGANLLADILTLSFRISHLVRHFHQGQARRTRPRGMKGTGTVHPNGLARTYLLRRDGLLTSLAKLLNGLRVITQILFAANKNDGKALAEMENLGNPL